MEVQLNSLRKIITEIQRGNNVFMEIETDSILQNIEDGLTQEAMNRSVSPQQLWMSEIVPLLKNEFDYSDERAEQLKKIIFPNSVEW